MFASDCAILVSSDVAPTGDGNTRGDGNCGVDVNECDSNPCENGALCTDSTTDASLPVASYRCSCIEGFASGMCGYTLQVPIYISDCQISTSIEAGLVVQTATTAPASVDRNRPYGNTDIRGDGNCAIDMNECTSNPCRNDAVCSDSTTDFSAAPLQELPSEQAIGSLCPEEMAGCSAVPSCLTELSEALEAGQPNGTEGLIFRAVFTCVQSNLGPTPYAPVDADAYRCACADGYASGTCDYAQIVDIQSCSVMSSTDASAAGDGGSGGCCCCS